MALSKIRRLLGSVYADAQIQWRRSPVVRLGALMIGVVGLTSAFLEFSDRAEHARAEVKKMLALERRLLRELASDDAAAQGQAWATLRSNLHQLAWQESSVAVSEASFQEWLRGLTAKLGLKVVSLKFARAVADSGAEGGQTAANPAFKGQANGVEQGSLEAAERLEGLMAYRAQLMVELNTPQVLGLVNELTRAERWVFIEKFQMSGNSSPATATLNLKIWIQNENQASAERN